MDAIRDLEKQDFIGQQLASYAGPKKEDGQFTKILCPFHAEKTPSASVRKTNGWLHCFGCGQNSRYDDWAALAGLEPYQKGPPKENFAMSILLGAADNNHANDDKPYLDWKLKNRPLPTGKLWRTIPTDLLIELGGRLCTKYSEKFESWGSTKYINLPVMVNGSQKGMFLARLKKDPDQSSYLLAPSAGSAWSKTWGLWPFDYAVEMMKSLGSTTMVVVEGQRDALRLLLNDIPAVCIFGTQSWSKNKARLLEVAGVETVVQFFDGDRAGIRATEGTLPDLRRLFEVKTIRLWSIKGSPYIPYADIESDEEQRDQLKADKVTLWDPGNAPQWIINRIKKKYL